MFPLACLHVLYRTEVVDAAWLEEKPFSHRMAKTDAKASPARMTLQMPDGKRNVLIVLNKTYKVKVHQVI
jgi:DNA primase